MKYKVFNELTVAEYQELYNINRSDTEEIDKAIQSVAVLTGLASWQVEDLALEDFNKVSREIAVIFSAQVVTAKLRRTFLINGKRFRVIYNPRKLSAGQYIDFQTFLSAGNTIENLHKLIACIIVPYKRFGKGRYDSENHEKIAEGVQDLNFCQINAVCVFFLELWKLSIRALEPYLLRQLNQKEMASPWTKADLQKIMDGFLMQSV